MPRRIINLRDIGFRLIDPRRGLSHMSTNANPQAGIVWSSCNPAFKKPEKPKAPKQPQYIFQSQVTVIKNPNFVEFSDPCT